VKPFIDTVKLHHFIEHRANKRQRLRVERVVLGVVALVAQMNELFVFQNVLDVSERLDEWNDAKSERAGVGEELPQLDLAERRRMPQDGMTPIWKLVLVFKQQGVDLVARETVQPRVEI